ncbi:MULTISPECIES: hypothetical protein [Thermomonospora]|uniref:DnaJ-class molecular chaperone n=1 Tax=Thermomonospora cellulosilytica TaxID=1411118 RepID=A0A7W3MUB3_9ACTN|nr:MULTISPECIES: hypothetical protein [Thermomonospora]MBA9002061.1 DnaJ-class molecular chaperone [Thermomonospora cellulosilytica]
MSKKDRPADVYRDCGICDGRGWHQPDPKKSPHDCPYCGGTGRVKVR